MQQTKRHRNGVGQTYKNNIWPPLKNYSNAISWYDIYTSLFIHSRNQQIKTMHSLWLSYSWSFRTNKMKTSPFSMYSYSLHWCYLLLHVCRLCFKCSTKFEKPTWIFLSFFFWSVRKKYIKRTSRKQEANGRVQRGTQTKRKHKRKQKANRAEKN